MGKLRKIGLTLARALLLLVLATQRFFYFEQLSYGAGLYAHTYAAVRIQLWA